MDSLVYPDNYVKNDLGYLIPSHESAKIKVLFTFSRRIS